MVLFSKLALAAASIAAVSAAPWEPSVKLSTHRARAVSDNLTIESFHPTTIYETYETGITTPLKKRGDNSGTIEQSAASFVEEKLQLSNGEYNIRSSANTETGGSVWIQQLVNGIPVANAVANVALNTDKDVVAFGANFHGTSGSRRAANIAPPTPNISKEQAITSAEEKLHGKHNDKAPTLEYYVNQDGSLALTYVVEVQTEDGNHWYEAFVDASSAQVVATNDFVAGASYLAVDPRVQDVTKGYKTFTSPADTTASPNGWHKVGSTVSTDTSGNNVISYKGSTTGTTKQSAAGQVFNYRYDTTVGPTSGANVDAARVNTFFLSNKIHDINYRYGFTEKTFNFQNDNFGKGGAGNDRIKISVQDGSGVNNANFATPADGSSGLMRMYIWNRSTPNRDGDLSNDVIAHEQTHGTTNRMTGGGTGRCLQTTESGGLGEGWSDAFAEWLEHKDSSVPDWVLAAWVYNNPKGLRTYPYSTSASVNPLRYSSLATLTEVHAIGEVWANILHNVYAKLVGSQCDLYILFSRLLTKFYSGFASDAFTNPNSSAGNVVFLRLFYDALLLQPCNPTMVQARAAWIQADASRYKGKHKCTLWKAFASRGLGSGAVSGTYKDSTTVPSGC